MSPFVVVCHESLGNSFSDQNVLTVDVCGATCNKTVRFHLFFQPLGLPIFSVLFELAPFPIVFVLPVTGRPRHSLLLRVQQWLSFEMSSVGKVFGGWCGEGWGRVDGGRWRAVVFASCVCVVVACWL